jgi:putative addiction module component (TIGR02574 family)
VARAIQSLPAGFDEWSIDQQIDYVQALWDRIAARADQVPIPDWHRDVLDERLGDEGASPAHERAWEQVEAELRRHLKSRQ